jgi:hypothetical protein
MIYSSPREARAPGFDHWYWELLAALPRAKKILLVVGAFDSDGTIREVLDEAKRRGIPVSIHFVEPGPLRTVYESALTALATLVEDVDTFAEKNGIPFDDPGDISFAD